MSPRRSRRAGDAPAPRRPVERVDTVETDRRGAWVVRPVPAAAAKVYRCPGCDQEIRPGTPHLVVWPAEPEDPDDRRHWHTACWRRRADRRPNVQRSRNAPRYG